MFGPEAFHRGASIDQGPIDGEVFAAHQAKCTGMLNHSSEELARNVVFHKSLAVLRECRVVEAGLNGVHVEKPPKKKVVVQLLAEQTLASDGVEGHQQRRLQEPLRWNRRPAYRAIHPV